MAKYYMKEENLTSIADSIRNVYAKSDELTCADMVRNLRSVNDEVDEQTELVDKISRKFFIVDEDTYLEGAVQHLYNSVVTDVRKYAFDNYSSLITVNLPNVTTIENYAFNECTSLIIANLPNAISVGNEAFRNCTSLTSIHLPNCTSIGSYAFRNCTSLTSVDLSNCTSVEKYVFNGCTSLTNVNLPNVISIGYATFAECTSLTTVNLPNVTSIGEAAFYNCTDLTSVIICGNAVCVLTYDTYEPFLDTPIASGMGYIYVPSALIEDYKVAESWSDYANQFRAIEDYPDICGGVV